LPRTDSYFTVRVEAPGYISETRQVEGNRTRTIQVKLKRETE
jgi:hypothetical protein